MVKKRVKTKAKAKKKVSTAKKRKVSKPKAVKKVRRAVKAGVTRRSAKKAAAKSAGELNLEKIGEVTHYFPHVKAAAIMIMKGSLLVGEEIYIKGHTTDFKEKVISLQLDREPIKEGKKGQEIGLLVKSRVRIGDNVYRI